MDFKIIYSDEALADLEQITAWSWDHHPETTERFITALLNHIDLLPQFPSIGSPVKGKSGVRQLLHSPFRVYYRVNQQRGRIDILHIWHQSRRPPLYGRG